MGPVFRISAPAECPVCGAWIYLAWFPSSPVVSLHCGAEHDIAEYVCSWNRQLLVPEGTERLEVHTDWEG